MPPERCVLPTKTMAPDMSAPTCARAPHPRVLAAVLGAALAGHAGCGGGSQTGAGAEPPPRCLVDVTFSGGYDGALSGADPPSCAVPFGGDTDIWMVFMPVGGEVDQLEVTIEGITEGQTGSFPATAGVYLQGDRVWRTGSGACTVTVDEHAVTGKEDSFSKGYQVAGTGSCASPAEPQDGTSEPITIGAFSYRFPAEWAK